MDSSQAKEKLAPKSEKDKTPADPFASDIFAAPVAEDLKAIEIAPDASSAQKEKSWVSRLPKASRSAVEWNDLKRGLPPDFSDQLPYLLAESIAKYLNFSEKNPMEFLFLTERETSETPQTGDSWLANFEIENAEAGFVIEINDNFAVWLVDATLGERISDQARSRDLTASEIAVLEFLAVNLTFEANKIIHAPLFKFRGFSRKFPDLPNKNGAAKETSLLVSNWQTVHGFLQSIVKIYLTPGALKALQTEENKLLTAAPRRAARWLALETRVRDVRARLFLGETPTTLADVAGLETGDVVLPEKYGFSIVGDDFQGTAEIFLGAGESVKLSGNFAPPETFAPPEFEKTSDENLVRRLKSSEVLRFTVKRIEALENLHLLEKPMPKELESDEKEIEETLLDETDEGGGVPIENLAVTMRVELEARRLSLAEVGGLRVNQIIELSARATDAVNLLIEDKIVARGELVEVEDRLGVRIIQILR